MPPKRKHKATTKPPKPAARQAHPRAARNGLARGKSNVQGGKSSTSRLQPSEPLHMTTRKAAVKAHSNPASPAAPSGNDGSSRRTSLNSLTPFQDDNSNFEDERPAKRSRVSTDSGSPPNQTGSFVSQLPDDETESKPESRANSNASKPPSKKRRASGGSSETSNTAQNGRNNGSDAKTTPRRKKRKTIETPSEPVDAPPELTDSSTPPGSPEPIPEVASSQGLQNVLPVNGEGPAKPTRRLPGRRRQPHSDINVEIDLRRQLSIKMGYRSLAKIQKAILEELSNRTIANLENDPDFHKQGPEYDHVMAQLNQRLANRIAQLDAERKLKLDQLERLRLAEENIQREQFINRFEEFQDNFVLQCLYRVKQLERRMKAEQDTETTDDEEHIVKQTTRVEFPMHDTNDVLGSKFASRSRAYVETERMIEDENIRRRFDQQRKSFLAKTDDNYDPAERLPDGFATFTGPDRTEALAHHNIASLVDAAMEVENAPSQPEPPKIITPPKVIPNEEANALFLLASISADRPPEVRPQNRPDDAVPQAKDSAPEETKNIISEESKVASPEEDYIPFPQEDQEDQDDDQEEEYEPPSQFGTPTQPTGLNRELSPVAPMSAASTAMSLETAMSVETARSSPAKISDAQDSNARAISPQESHAVIVKVPDAPKNVTPARISTHRIMDILNDDQDVKLPKRGGESRESQPSVHEQASHRSPPRHEGKNYNQSSSHYAAVRPREESPPYHPEDAEYEPQRPRSRSPSHPNAYWSSRNLGTSNEQANPKDTRNPMDRVKLMLERIAESPKIPEQSEDSARGRSDESQPRHERSDRHQMAPPLARPFSPQDRSHTGKSSRPMHYEQSPHDRHRAPYGQSSHQDSYNQAPQPQWNNGRRSSGSQPVPPRSPRQPYASEYGRPGPAPPTHQSPYPPSNPHEQSSRAPVEQHQNPLPPKPPAKPKDMNIRFAHYDAAPRAPSQRHAPYPGAAQPPPPGPPPPSYGHGQQPYAQPTYAQPPPQPVYQGYVPPPGSFQAPPPPPAALQPYPQGPLKYQQYGGQPILPANMAPPPQHPHGPITAFNQHPQPTHNHIWNPPPRHRQNYDIPANERPKPQERDERDQRDRPPETQPRPRRQYRSYIEPGTEFRPYQHPSQRGRR